MNYKLFNVESRKGGVGKTTIALNLAKVLIAKNYSVLLLDCDITGTSITEAASNSEFWKDYVNNINNKDGKALNLLEFFKNEYLTGIKSPTELIDNENVLVTKINVIGSDIYSLDHNPIINPSQLIDELHSFWFLSMLREIAERFAVCIKKKKTAREVAIIVDNSPGFLGISQCVHEWMGELGPQYAKCMLVSSYDEQDVKSCVDAAFDIKECMTGYISQAKYFDDLIKSENDGKEIEEPKTNGSSKNFFYKLVDGKEYKQLIEKEYDISEYIGLVFNKVPTGCLDDSVCEMYKVSLPTNSIELLKDIYMCDERQNCIGFDQYVSYQFFSTKLLNNNSFTDSESKKWSKKIKNALKSGEKELANNELVRATFKKDSTFCQLLNNIRQVKSKHFFKDFSDSWYPCYALDMLANDYKEWKSLSYRLEKCLPEDWSKGDLAGTIVSDMKAFIDKMGFQADAVYIESLINHLLKLSGLDKKFVGKGPLTLTMIFCFMLTKSFSDLFEEGMNFRTFINDESQRNQNTVRVPLLAKDKLSVHGVEFPMPLINSIIPKIYSRFYVDFCLVLSRLMSLEADYEMLLSAIQHQISRPRVILLSKEVRTYLDDVFVRRSENASVEILSEKMNKPAEMFEIESILKGNILKNWNV